MKTISKQALMYIILFLSVTAVSSAKQSKFQELSRKLQSGEWQEKSQAAKELSKMKEVPVGQRIQLLQEALEKECQSKTSDIKPMGSYKTISIYLKDEYVFALADAAASDIMLLEKHLEKAKDEAGDRLTLALGLLKKQATIATKISHLVKNSQDGYLRSLSIRILGTWGDPNLAPIFKESLNDNFKVVIQTDIVTPNTYKAEDGYYYYDYYPVRNEAACALRALGVNIRRDGNNFLIIQTTENSERAEEKNPECKITDPNTE